MPAAIWPISSKIVNCCGAEGGTKFLVCARETENITRLIIIKYTNVQLLLVPSLTWLYVVITISCSPFACGPVLSLLETCLAQTRPSGVVAVALPAEGFPWRFLVLERTVDLAGALVV